MKSASSTANRKSDVWKGMVDFEREFSPTAARALLQIRISSHEHHRLSELLEKARSGLVTVKEEAEIDAYERLGALLGILHSKARQALKKRAAV